MASSMWPIFRPDGFVSVKLQLLGHCQKKSPLLGGAGKSDRKALSRRTALYADAIRF